MTARFVIESPFQLMMAEEARQQLGIHDAELVVLWPSGRDSIESIKDVLGTMSWSRVIDGGRRTRTGHLGRARLVRQLGRRPQERLFIGDYLSPYMRHLAMTQPLGSVHLLDDGRGTIAVHRARVGGTTQRPPRFAAGWRRRAALRLLRIRSGDVPALDYFTIFDLSTSPPDSVTPNHLDHLKSRVETSRVVDQHLILGAPFCERGMMLEDRYLAILEAISASENAGGTYRPHRDESPAKVERIRSFGMTVASSGSTVESELISAHEVPARVTTFFSTASFTLWKLFGDVIDVGSYALEEDDFAPGWFATGDGLPDLLDQTGGALRVEPIPGRDPSYIVSYLCDGSGE